MYQAETPDEKLKKKLREIAEVRKMCKANFNGYLELAFLPRTGGWDEQPARRFKRILLIIGLLNNAITDKREQEK